MPRILIISAHYYPFFHPRAHRWTVLAEHWAGQGYAVHVITGRQRGVGEQETVNGVQVHRTGSISLKDWVGYKLGMTPEVDGGASPVSARMRVLLWLYRHIWKRLYWPDDACVWYFPARQKALQLLAQEPFDAVVTVALPFTGHLIGLSLRRHYPALRWLADTGDPFSFQAFPLNNSWLYDRLNRRMEQRVLQSVDVMTVTTEATRRKYLEQFGAGYADKISVIPPLLHPFEPQEPRVQSTDRTIRIGYFGALYRPMRTPDAFLQVLKQLAMRYPDLYNRLEVHFYGAYLPDISDAFREFPVIRCHGLLSRETVRSAMRRMDILLHLGNRSDFQLPSKAVEYLAAGRPVWHFSHGDPDPFVEFWPDKTGIWVSKVENGEQDLDRVAVWLEQVGGWSGGDDLGLLTKFGVGEVSKRYMEAGLLASCRR